LDGWIASGGVALLHAGAVDDEIEFILIDYFEIGGSGN
jgi:hypothetical protein